MNQPLWNLPFTALQQDRSQEDTEETFHLTWLIRRIFQPQLRRVDLCLTLRLHQIPLRPRLLFLV